jgi:hypothetical protein
MGNMGQEVTDSQTTPLGRNWGSRKFISLAVVGKASGEEVWVLDREAAG